jgi:phenylacetate-coenzyme A ligase PaaK-like adenylate-forming protein
MEKWDKVQNMSSKDIKKLQSKNLKSFLRHAQENIPYYRKVFKEKDIDVSRIKSTDDLQNIPFTTKADMVPREDDRRKPYQFASQFLEGEYRTFQTLYTGGNTAEAVPIVYSVYDNNALREIGGERIGDIYGLDRENDVIINAFPYKPHLAFWQAFHTTMGLGATAVQSGGGKILGTDKIITALERLEATAFFSPPGYAFYTLGGAVVFEKDIHFLETVVLGMDLVNPDYKERIKEVLLLAGAEQPRVVGEYILSEAKHAWAECSDSTGYHTYPDLDFIEIIDPQTDERLAEGEKGEIVYTALDGGGTSVLRFKTGDLGKLLYEECPVCERTVPRIVEVEKCSNYVPMVFPDGEKTVNMNEVYNLLMCHRGVVQWQLEITRREGYDAVHLLISVMKGMDESEVVEELTKRLPQETGLQVEKITTHRLRDLLPRLGFESEYMERRIVDSR